MTYIKSTIKALYIRSLHNLKSVIITVLLFVSSLTFALDNPSFPLMFNLKNSTNYFVGREEFLKNMHDFFFNSDSSDKKDNDSLVVSGAAGSGKTQVITRYAELHKTNYNIIWWFDLSKDLDLQYRNFAKKWNKMITKHYQDLAEQQYLQIHLESTNTDNIREEIYDRLKATELSWLIVLDNVEESVTVLKDMPKHSKKKSKANSQGYGHIIVSTQNSTYHQNVMRLDKLTREESVELLLKVTGESDSKNADQLADTLNDYPLAVSRAGSFIAYHTTININEYNRLFLNKRQELWEAENKLRIQLAEFASYKATVFTTLSMIINDIKKESKMAYDLLAMVSFLDNETIPEDLLIQYIKNEHGKDAVDIDCKSALSILMRYSLLNRNYLSNKKAENKAGNSETNNLHSSNNNLNNSQTLYPQKTALFSTHELIQLVMQDLLKGEGKRKKEQEKQYELTKIYLHKAIIAINDLLPNNIYSLTDLLYNSSYLIPHITSLLKSAEDMELYNNDVLLLMLKSLEYNLTVMRKDREADSLLKKIDEVSKKLKDNDLDDFIKMRLSVMKSAYLAWVKADYPASLKEILSAYELMQKQQQASTKRTFFTYKQSASPTQAISLEDQLMIYTRLARMHNMMGNNPEASKYIELGKEVIKEADKINLNLFGYKEDFFVSIAKVELDNGNYNQALEYYNLCANNDSNINNKNQAKQEQKKKEQILPSNISIFLINIDILIGLGKYQEAMQKLDSLKTIVDKLPEENFYKLSVMTYYSYVQAMLGGNLTGAIKTSLSHQAMLKKYFGEIGYYKNRHAFMSHKFLGEIYEKQGNYLKAEEEYSTALRILNNVYNNSNHSSTDKISDIYSKLTMVNIKLNNIAEAIEYFKLHRYTFGNEHPRSQMLEEYFIDNKVDLGF